MLRALYSRIKISNRVVMAPATSAVKARPTVLYGPVSNNAKVHAFSTLQSENKTNNKQKVVVCEHKKNIAINYMPSFRFHKAAQQNTQPKNDIVLPVVDELAGLFPGIMENTNLSMIIHAMPSMFAVIKALVEKSKLDPSKTFISGKFNSECKSTIDEIKKLGINYLVDFLHPYKEVGIKQWYDMEYKTVSSNDFPLIRFKHGNVADLKEEIKYQTNNGLVKSPRKIIEGESTASGEDNITANSLFPVVSYARCAIKRHLEAPLIAEQINNRLCNDYPEFRNQRGLYCCVIGYGAVGKALVHKLIAAGHIVMVYDPHVHEIRLTQEEVRSIRFAMTPIEAVRAAKYIFQCSASDLTREQPDRGDYAFYPEIKYKNDLAEILIGSSWEKVFFSCSSDRVAFRKLISQIEYCMGYSDDPLKKIIALSNYGASVEIPNGGYPFNFTKIADASDPQDIQLTRAMLLGSILQAKLILDNEVSLDDMPRNVMLDPFLQRFIVERWEHHHPNPYRLYSKQQLQQFKNIDWIIRNSGGSHVRLANVEKAIDFFMRNDTVVNDKKLLRNR